MKKWLLLMLLAVCSAGLAAAEPAAEKKSDEWTVFQLGFLPGAPSDMAEVPVYGVRGGAPICAGSPVWGVEASVLYSGAEKVYGVQCSIISNQAQKVYGLQFGIANFVESCAGLQLGIYNSAADSTVQLGLLNHIEGSCLPWCIVFNCKF